MTTVGVVTGAGRGMGASCAGRLVDTVDALLLVDRDEPSVQAMAGSLSRPDRRVEAFALDVTDPVGIGRLADRVAELGTLRACAHAAGISPTMADWRRVLTVDLVGSALLVDALAEHAGPDAAFVCFASMAAHLITGQVNAEADAALDAPLAPDFLDRLHAAVGDSLDDSGIAYGWAKRGVLRLVQREAVRLGRRGARICSVSPGIIDTPQGRQESAARPTSDLLVAKTPLAREGRPEELAAAVAFLLSDEASFVSGIDLLVDGGCAAALRTGADPVG